jgi:hypothetical protein
MTYAELLDFVKRYHLTRFLVSAVVGMLNAAIFVAIIWLLVKLFLIIA